MFIDYRMMGVGGDNSWGAIAHEPYLIRPGVENTIEYGFSIVPLTKGGLQKFNLSILNLICPN